MHPRVGARQVGKTTLINRLFGDTHQTFVFDPVQDLYGERADPQLFLRNSPAPLILDEIQYSVRIFDDQTRENLAEYMARPPLSLKIIRHEPFKSRVLFHTTYSEYFKQICEDVRCVGLHPLGAPSGKGIRRLRASIDPLVCPNANPIFRSSPLSRKPYCGLDEHFENHFYPAVPSRNLGKLRDAIGLPIPELIGVVASWREIFAIAKRREQEPDQVLVPINLEPA